MYRCRVLAVVISAVSIVACATAEPQQSAENHTDKSSVTGSRTRSESGYVRSVQGKQPVDDMMQNTNTVSSSKSGP
jgi:hypothetical protein